MKNTHFLRVFTDAKGNFGDRASVVIDEGKHISDSDRQAMAQKINTGETIFVNDLDHAKISVMHSQGEIDFAGVGVLGTAWLLRKLGGKPIKAVYGRGGEIKTWEEGELIWIQTSLDTVPPWNLIKRTSAEEINKISESDYQNHTIVWAWIDEEKGLIRARTFASDWDIPEAEANGSGSMMLAASLKRKIEIIHGKGSVIFAKPEENNHASLGGRVIDV